MKYCVNCRWASPKFVCVRPRLKVEHMVFGMISGPNYTCNDERDSINEELCGAHAQFFEEKTA